MGFMIHQRAPPLTFDTGGIPTDGAERVSTECTRQSKIFQTSSGLRQNTWFVLKRARVSMMMNLFTDQNHCAHQDA
jgi:hypothetical protein